MKKAILVLTILTIVLAGAFAAGQTDAAATAKPAFPERNIDVVVHSSAGGGSDVWARKVSALMEPHLGVKLIVSNKPGGNGGVAANYVWQQQHDGYTIIGASESAMTYGVNDAIDKTMKNWHFFFSGGSPGVIVVKADSPFKTFEDLVTAARKAPNTVVMANSGMGKLWHLKVAMLNAFADVPFKHAAYAGSAPAIVALMSGEAQALSCSAGEAVSYVQSGDMRPLIMTELESYTFKGSQSAVRPVVDVFPQLKQYLPMPQILCLITPRDIPDEAYQALGAAFDKAMESPEMAEFIDQQAAVKVALWGPEADKMAEKMESLFSWFAHDAGATKVAPDALGIPKP